jgi:[ribosomal protein S5]-alanine N-acetyltransferase
MIPTLTTQRLVLRGLRLDDAGELHAALSDDANMRYWSCGPIATVEEVREYIRWNVEGEGVQCFAIAWAEARDVALGWVVLIDRRKDMLEIGFITTPATQGQGVAREATRCVVDYAFETRGIRRIYADVDPDNAASIKLIEWLGLRREGHLRGTWETHIGVRDSLIYGLLRSDLDL